MNKLNINVCTMPYTNGATKKRHRANSFRGLLCVIFCCFIYVGAFAQINLPQKKVSLKILFEDIKKQTGYVFVSNNIDLASIEVEVELHNLNLKAALDLVLTPLSMEYQIVGKTVIISKKANKKEKNIGLFIDVHGVLVDSLGDALPNATITDSVTGKRITTNNQGAFTFKNIKEGSLLKARYIGYQTTVFIAKSDIGRIVLKPISETLEEVKVSNGIFERPLQNFTGAATIYSGAQLREISPTSILTALKALDASFQVPDDNTNGSDPNTVPRVQMRGTNSIQQTDMASEYGYISNPPLIIIDGFESTLEKLYDMDINRVGKVTLLKDAAATAIYGSKSANGVLVVETIQPKQGQTIVNYTHNSALSIPDLSSFNLMNSEEKLKIEEIGGYYKDRDFTTQNTLDDVHNLVKHSVEKGVNTYWLSQPLQMQYNYTHNLTVSSGKDRQTFMGIINYGHNGGIMKGSSRNNFSGSLQSKYISKNKNFSMQGQFTLSTTKANNTPYGSFSDYSVLNPYWMARDESGNITRYVDILPTDGENGLNANAYISHVINPLFNSTLQMVNKSDALSLQGNMWAELRFTKDLNLRSTFSYSVSNTETNVFRPGQASDFFSTEDFSKRGSYTNTTAKTQTYQSNTTFNFGHIYGKHTIFASGGVALNDNGSRSVILSVIGFPSAKLDDLLYGLNYSTTKPRGSYSKTRTVGFIGNTSYAYDNRFLFDGSFKIDGSSVFGVNNRFGKIWSIGTGWNMHKEAFFKYVPLVSRFKLRGSYGYTGSVNFPSYASTTSYSYTTSGRYLDFVPATIIAMGNPDLVWQRTKKLNLGLDAGFLKDKLSATFNYFIETTDDLIQTTTSAPSTGFTSYSANLGKSRNVGYELYLSARILDNPQQKLSWVVSTSFYHNKNTLLKITDQLAALNESAKKLQDSSGNTTPVLQYKEGSSVSTLYAVRSLGIDASNGYEIFLDRNGKQTYIWSSNDLVAMGDMQPKLNMTINNQFRWKWIRLNFGLNIQLGGVMYNTTLANKIENLSLSQNLDKRALGSRWTTPGVAADYKGLTDLEGYTRTDNATYVTSRFVQKNNAIEITGLSIDPGGLLETYLNKFLMKGIAKLNGKMNSVVDENRVSVRFYMNNVFRLSSLSREKGTTYPFNRSFTLNISVKL